MISPAHRESFRRLVDAHRRLVLTTHVNPDGDAIGSEVALARVLTTLGSQVSIVNQDPTPLSLEFLLGDGIAIEPYEPAIHDRLLDAAEVIVLLDNSAPDRLGRVEGAVTKRAGRVFCIDHHPTRGTPWAWNILDEEASATASIVYELIRDRGLAVTRRIAEALYVGLATDTGFFRFNSTRPRAHEIAADLLRAGADPARSYQEVCERNSPAYTRLLGHALAAMRLDASGAVASIRITRSMIDDCAAAAVDTSEMTTALLAIDGVRIALLFRENAEGRVKVSLRSKGAIDVHALASTYGGGGHRNASGIVTAGRLDEVMESVIGRACALLEDAA